MMWCVEATGDVKCFCFKDRKCQVYSVFYPKWLVSDLVFRSPQASQGDTLIVQMKFKHVASVFVDRPACPSLQLWHRCTTKAWLCLQPPQVYEDWLIHITCTLAGISFLPIIIVDDDYYSCACTCSNNNCISLKNSHFHIFNNIDVLLYTTYIYIYFNSKTHLFNSFQLC